MKYKCMLTFDSGHSDIWEASISMVAKYSGMSLVVIEGRGMRFHAIVGNSPFGSYLCIPEIDAGCALSRLDDIFWNTERLSRHMGIADATTIATGLKYINEL